MQVHSMADRVSRFAHLAPFVQVSREKYRREVQEEFEETSELILQKRKSNEVAEIRVKDEINQWCSDDSVSGYHSYDNKWTGTFCYCISCILMRFQKVRQEMTLPLVIEEVLKTENAGR